MCFSFGNESVAYSDKTACCEEAVLLQNFSIHVILLIPIFVQFKMHPRFACCTKNSIKMCPTNTERTPCSQVRSRQPGVFSETSRLVYARDGAAVAHHAAPRTPSYNLALYFSSVPPQAPPPPRWSA